MLFYKSYMIKFYSNFCRKLALLDFYILGKSNCGIYQRLIPSKTRAFPCGNSFPFIVRVFELKEGEILAETLFEPGEREILT